MDTIDQTTLKEIENYLKNLIITNKELKVKELIDITQKRYDVSENLLIDLIDSLKDQGKIKLTSSNKTSINYASSKRFCLSIFRDKEFNPNWIVLCLTLLTIMAISLIPETDIYLIYLRWVLGIIFTIFLPGYSLLYIIFPEKNLDYAEIIGLSLGLSLAITPLIGLLLNFTPIGITLFPVVAFLSIFILICNLISMYKKFQKTIKKKDKKNK